MQINMTQEKMIETLKTKLYFKDSEVLRLETNLKKFSDDIDHVKRKYQRLKTKK